MGSCFSQPLQRVIGPSKNLIGGPEIKTQNQISSNALKNEKSNSSSEDSDTYSYDYEEYDDEDNSANNGNKSNEPNAQRKTKIRRIRKNKQQINEEQQKGSNSISIIQNSPINIQTQNDPLSAKTRPYFSFTSFMIQNPNPQIYEWLFEQEIAKGSLAQIYMVKHTETGRVCAAKVYNNAVLHLQTIGSNEEQPFLCIKREIDVLCGISHPNIMPILEVIEDNPTNSLIMVVPYASQGNFGDHIFLAQQNKIDENQDPVLSIQSVLVCFYQIIEALIYLHSKGYVHRNINPSSILILDYLYFSLSEFKFVEKVILDENSNNKLLTDTKGSPLFYSPEACSGKSYDGKLNDIWALGVTFYLIFFGKLPYGLSEKVQTHASLITKSITENALEFPLFFIHIPNQTMKRSITLLLSNLLQKDPEKRISLEECAKSAIFNEAKEIVSQQGENPSESE